MIPGPTHRQTIQREVHAHLESAPAYRALPGAVQVALASAVVKIVGFLTSEPDWLDGPSVFLAATPSPGPSAADSVQASHFATLTQEVDFPEFVSGLIRGVFHAVVDLSVQQMRAYGELLSSVAQKVDEFDSDRSDCTLTREPTTAKRETVRSRQRMVATMVMLGINRIVVTDGEIHAKSF